MLAFDRDSLRAPDHHRSRGDRRDFDGLSLRERAPGVSIEQIQKATEPVSIIEGDIPEMKLQT